MNQFYLLIIIIPLISGCTSSKKIIVSQALDAIPAVTGSIINPSVFDTGGTLALGTFKPGANASADDQTDKLSSMIIKGFKDVFSSQSNHFTLQKGNINDSDAVLEGFIAD